MINVRVRSLLFVGALAAWGCSSGGGGGGGTGGVPATGGSTGGTATGGAKATGGTTNTGGSATGGGTATGGVPATGGAGGGLSATGGTGTAGKPAGGAGGPGGAKPTGGSAGGSGGGSTGTGVTVKLDATHQTIQGFGLNDALISSAWSSTVLDNLFTTNGDSAIGLSILRIGMNSSGRLAATNQGNIDGAKSRKAKIIGSCWTPPASCKTNGSEKDGGHVMSSCYGSWSDTITSFAKTNGLYAMSIANEPDFASCGNNEPCNGSYETTLYTAKEMVAFIKVAGPKLQAAGIKVISPEASEWTHIWSNESACCSEPGKKNSSDPLKCGFPPTNAACTTGDGYDYGHFLAKDADAWKALDILGVHEYDSQHAEPWPSDVTVARKEVWQTEMSGVKWWPEQGTLSNGTLTGGSDTIQNGVAVAGWIHSALVVGEVSAWVWWWYSAYGTDDNEGLLLKNSSKLTRRYFALGNYSKFLQPGKAVMVEVSGNSSSDLLLSAFKNPDSVVVVAVNKGSAAANVPITIAGGTAPASCTPNVTSATDNLKAGTAVTVTNGVFMAALPSMTITTFVCK